MINIVSFCQKCNDQISFFLHNIEKENSPMKDFDKAQK